MPGRREERPNPGYDRGNREGKEKKRGMNLKKVFAVSFCIVLGVVLISGGCLYKVGHGLYSNINYVADEDIRTVETLPEEAIEETLSTEERMGVAVSDEDLDSIHDQMANIAATVETKEDEEVYNILLVGVDRRDKTWNGNSDSMILVSIDRARNKVSMVSLMRDTYVNIPDIGYKKLNYAYAYGAGPLLCQTITDNFRIQVNRYAAVDFFDLIEIIDIIGGVDLEVSAAEVEVANGYIIDMCENLMNIDSSEHLFPAGGGMIHCDGVQAVGYARNRYVGNSDFQRTERQRYVIRQLMEEAKRMSVTQMMEKMQGILQYVTMNIPETEIWSMITEVPEFLQYEVEMGRIPYDNMYDIIYVGGQDMLVPYWEDTLAKLQAQIYG